MRAPTIKAVRGTVAIKGISDNEKGHPIESQGRNWGKLFYLQLELFCLQ